MFTEAILSFISRNDKYYWCFIKMQERLFRNKNNTDTIKN